MVRDATALTASITGGSIGLPENVYTLDSPLDDATHAKVFTQELRFAGGKDRFKWVVGGFYANTKRNYGQNLFVDGFTELTGIPTAGQHRPRTTCSSSRTCTTSSTSSRLRRRHLFASRARSA